jgi:hypothetical protein
MTSFPEVMWDRSPSAPLVPLVPLVALATPLAVELKSTVALLPVTGIPPEILVSAAPAADETTLEAAPTTELAAELTAEEAKLSTAPAIPPEPYMTWRLSSIEGCFNEPNTWSSTHGRSGVRSCTGTLARARGGL